MDSARTWPRSGGAGQGPTTPRPYIRRPAPVSPRSVLGRELGRSHPRSAEAVGEPGWRLPDRVRTAAARARREPTSTTIFLARVRVLRGGSGAVDVVEPAEQVGEVPVRAVGEVGAIDRRTAE